MNNIIKKPLALALSATVLLGSISVSAFAINSSTKQEKKTYSKNTVTASSDKKDDEKKNEKNETVYVLANSDGSVKKIIVSDWIKNSLKNGTISDKSDNLTNVENLKGDESYSMNGDNMRVWDADGNDIYYKGEISKDLPVDLSVSYYLDGNKISAEDLLGKSGKVTIRYDYKNNQYETVSIDGKDETIYVPFAMLTGVMLDGDKFKNVEITNGKILNDGDRVFAAGIAFPGLSDNLNISKDKFEIPDYVEITAEVTDFELTNTVTIATNDLFNNIDTDNLDSLDELTDSIDELSSSMDKLINGSSSLYGGLTTLLEKSGTLIDGIDTLASGAKQLKTGAGDLYNGTKTLKSGTSQLASGAKELASGLSTITSNNDTLVGGAKQVFNTLLATATSSIKDAGLTIDNLTIDNYAKVLNAAIDSLDSKKIAKTARETALKTVTAEVEKNRSTVEAAVTAGVKEEVTKKVTATVRETVVKPQVLASLGYTVDAYNEAVKNNLIDEATKTSIENAIDSALAGTAAQNAITANVDAQMASDEIKATIKTTTDQKIEELINNNMNSSAVQDKITEALKTAQSGAAKISELKSQLDAYNEFYIGIKDYTSGVSKAKSGADTLSKGAVTLDSGASDLKSGSKKLSDGINKLYDGILTMKDGSPALVDGIKQLKDGSLKLSAGLKEFNEKGIKKITDAIKGDAADVLTRAKATIDVSKDYKAFSGVSDDMDGHVKFIYRTDAIEK